MSDKVYRIKPLVWEKLYDDEYRATVVLIDYIDVFKGDRGWYCPNCHGIERLLYDTVEAAQAVAEAWYRERIAAALVEAGT